MYTFAEFFQVRLLAHPHGYLMLGRERFSVCQLIRNVELPRFFQFSKSLPASEGGPHGSRAHGRLSLK